jgi:DDE domain/Arm DNA-binding domain
MDETSVSVGGRWKFLYRAVDRNGRSVHLLLREDRTIGSAQEFFRQAVKVKGSVWPEKINLDGNPASHLGLRLLEEEDSRWRSVTVRARRYINNVIEQDHRAIKQRSRAMLGLKSFPSAAVTLLGIELAHRIRKRQFTLTDGREGRALSLKELWDQALSDKSFSQCPPFPSSVNAPDLTALASAPARTAREKRRGSLSEKGALWPKPVPSGQSQGPPIRRYWHYRYRFAGRQKELSLGRYPYVPVESARARRHAARHFLEAGVDPAGQKQALRRIVADGV